jgi:hypothetical protein
MRTEFLLARFSGKASLQPMAQQARLFLAEDPKIEFVPHDNGSKHSQKYF